MSRVLTFFATLALIGAAFLGYIGYFGGPVFTEIAATGRPSPRAQGLAAVMLSGDMGFRIGMAPRIGARLAAEGIPVLGINSLTFFRQRRSPAETMTLISAAIRRAVVFGHARRIVLIGQSFGADMLQAALPELPPDLRAKVVLVALVVPGDTLDFRASPAELFNIAAPDAGALPTARRLDWAPALCIHGAEEPHSLCPLLDLPNMRRVTLPGDHFLHHDADRVHAVLLDAIRDVTKSSWDAQPRAMPKGLSLSDRRTSHEDRAG